jgi:hypothetical protein
LVQVCIKHVVDDVLDLTRSLVNPDVELQNTVPAELLVLGDTGRIVQVRGTCQVWPSLVRLSCGQRTRCVYR